jgi:dTDP-4-dehydrorhamnose reductase
MNSEGNILDTLLENLFTTYNPTYAINCAAYTAVDGRRNRFGSIDK